MSIVRFQPPLSLFSGLGDKEDTVKHAGDRFQPPLNLFSGLRSKVLPTTILELNGRIA